jgi:hypothetical protein
MRVLMSTLSIGLVHNVGAGLCTESIGIGMIGLAHLAVSRSAEFHAVARVVVCGGFCLF